LFAENALGFSFEVGQALGQASPSSARVYAALAEKERRLISERTKAALQAAKARGKRLGRNGAERLAPAYKAEAAERAKALAPVLSELQGAGLSARAMAVELNHRGQRRRRVVDGTRRRSSVFWSAFRHPDGKHQFLQPCAGWPWNSSLCQWILVPGSSPLRGLFRALQPDPQRGRDRASLEGAHAPRSLRHCVRPHRTACFC
jgi:hypothetical protein